MGLHEVVQQDIAGMYRPQFLSCHRVLYGRRPEGK